MKRYLGPRTGGRRGSAGILVAVAAATIGLIYGYDTGNISGALLFITKDFHLSTTGKSSLTVSISIGLIVGALIAGPLANWIGRKGTIIAVAVGYVIFAVASGAAPGLVWLDVFRFLLGVAVGMSIVAAPVFIAETSPAAIRGALLVMYQVVTVAGIMAAYFIDFGLAGSGSWRIMLALSAAPSAIVLGLLLRIPDSPRWYLMKGRRAEAASTLAQVDPDVHVEHELSQMEEDLRAERGGRLIHMVRRPYLIATIFVVVLGFLVQITGINAITYYDPLIFKRMGFTGNYGLLILPGFVEVASLAATFVSLGIVDRLGRRVTLLTGIGAMLLGNAIMIALFAAGLRGGLAYVGFAGIVIFTAGFNFGFGSLVWVYSSESFPARLRSIGATTMLLADLIGNVLIAQFFLPTFNIIGGKGVFALFFALAAIAFAWVAWLAPETKGRPLETIRLYWENGRNWDRAEAALTGGGSAGGSHRAGTSGG